MCPQRVTRTLRNSYSLRPYQLRLCRLRPLLHLVEARSILLLPASIRLMHNIMFSVSNLEQTQENPSTFASQEWILKCS